MIDDHKGWGKEELTFEQYAYTEAGHALIYYLLRTGKITHFVPRDPSSMLPPFPGVKVTPHSPEWGGTTMSLGSLMTAAQVLLGGWVAFDEYQALPKGLDLKAIRVRRALGFLTGYAEEYVSDTDFAARDKAAMEWLDEMAKRVRNQLTGSWRAVEALANALIKEKRDLSEQEVFTIIEAALKTE